MAVAGKHHNVKLDELLLLWMVDVYINFKREAFDISLDFILAFNFNQKNCFPPPPKAPPPPPQKKGEVNIIPNIRVIVVLLFPNQFKNESNFCK